MLKKIIITVLILGVSAIGILYLIPWGEYNSTIEKSDLVKVVEKDSVGEEIPTLSLISGLHKAESGEGIAAEILFDVDGLKKTKGAFEEFTIQFDIYEGDYTKSELTVSIKAASINTRNKMRDESLADPDFFNTKKYPTITFQSTEITKTDTAYIAKGELTLLASTKTIDVPFKHLGKGENDQGQQFEAFEGNFSFDRTAYGMEEVSGAGNIVKLEFYCELIKQ